jgi:hypothetical protein
MTADHLPKHYRVVSTSNNLQPKPRKKISPKIPETPPTLETRKLTCYKDYECFEKDCDKSINKFTISFDKIPNWYNADRFIIEGYRRPTNSWRGCFLSLTYWHNETGNVYTHMFGALMLLPVIYWTLSIWISMQKTTILWDYVVIAAFLAGLLTCLACSTIFHLGCCHSRHVSRFSNKADYVGIVALQVGSFFPLIYYGFYCDSFLQIFYLSCVLLLGGITVLTFFYVDLYYFEPWICNSRLSISSNNYFYDHGGGRNNTWFSSYITLWIYNVIG